MIPPVQASRQPVVAHLMRAYLAGSETFVYNQIASLRRYRPVVGCHHLRPDTTFRRDGVIVASGLLSPAVARLDSLAYRMARLALPAASAALAARIRDEDARLLHYHFLTDARFLIGVRRRTGLPAVASAYGWDVSSFPRRLGGLGHAWLRSTFRELDCVLAMSARMRDDIVALGCPPERVRVHYHGVDTSRFRHPARRYPREEPATILCCGRLVPGKGQDVLLRAVHRVARRDVRVVLVGDGPLRPELERLIADLGLLDRVELCGHIPYDSPELPARYREADVLAAPSLAADGSREGIPGTVVEGMAAGLAVVSTTNGSIPAVVTSGRHGLLVAEGDVDAFAQALDALIDDPGLRERLGRAAAARAATELDLHARTAELERIYDALV